MSRYAFGTKLDRIPEIAGEDWEASRPLWDQKHGVRSVEVTGPNQKCGEADAIWTRKKNRPVAVITADCVPILLHHPLAVAAVHGGWRGLDQNILSHFFKNLPEEISNPYEWSAAIGPCIHADCYQVSAALIEDFVLKFPNLDRKLMEPAPRQLDLVAIAKHQLQELGVKLEFVSDECTHCTPDEKYCSYRRGDRLTRQYSVVVL
jgi:YfiH family protein